jgi:hypothetical protein
MLRCPPSRINLTPADIADFERRFIARHIRRTPPSTPSGVRLNPGPGRSTSLSLVSAEQNVGQKLAASSSSEVAFHEDGSKCTDTTGQVIPDRTRSCIEAAQALTSVIERTQPPLQASPRRQIDSFYESKADAVGEDFQRPPSPTQLPRLDGTTEIGGPHSLVEVKRELTITHHDILSPEERGLIETPRPCPADSRPRLLSSARARRRNCRSHNGYILHDVLPVTITERSSTSDDTVSSVPDLILPPPDGLLATNPTLDPGAPVFVPRTRFGTATGTSVEGGQAAALEPRWSSVDSSHSSLNLRIRSSSERNSDFALTARIHVPRERSGSSVGTTYQHGYVESEQWPRRGSRTADQNNTTVFASANIDRYPLLRPPLVSVSNTHDRSGRTTSRNLTLTHTTRLLSPSALQLQQHDLEASHIPQTATRRDSAHSHLSVHEDGTHLLSGSPATLSNSRSTPNFHPNGISPGRIYSRGSSLSWNRSLVASTNFRRVPSMASGASGISGGPSVGRKSSKEGLDAAAEFLRMRSSPLDDLTERLNRLSMSRPRSVGRSWERTPHYRPRMSLLTGDPFRPKASSDVPTAYRPTSSSPMPLAVPSVTSVEAMDVGDETVEDIVALSLALPPSSSLPSTPQALPSTPPAASSASYSKRSVADSQGSQAQCGSPPTCIKRKPVPSIKKTPKVFIYDDRKPPNTQPQTTSELRASTRRWESSFRDYSTAVTYRGEECEDQLATDNLRASYTPLYLSTISTIAE